MCFISIFQCVVSHFYLILIELLPTDVLGSSDDGTRPAAQGRQVKAPGTPIHLTAEI
jgi:hypothetical protein